MSAEDVTKNEMNTISTHEITEQQINEQMKIDYKNCELMYIHMYIPPDNIEVREEKIQADKNELI